MSSNASAKYPVRIPPEKRAELYRLTNPPPIAWPTVLLLLYIVGGIIAVDIAALKGWIPLWLGLILNVATTYPFFHVMHDSFHRAASTNVALNDWIGRIVMFAVGSMATMESVRYSHMLHHRFTNGPEDPDHYIHGNGWLTRPLRWITFDYHYVWNAIRSKDPRARKLVIQSLPYTLSMAAALLAIIYFGYGLELLMLWYLPQRITLGLISFVFLWLPHLDGDEDGELTHIRVAASSADNLTAGTTMRLGLEALLTPLMQWHNYHLIHHLWPTTPSYNHAKVWKLMEPELRERDLRIQRDFDLIPTLHIGTTAAVAAH
jgi:fatty acid desaturase